MTPNPLVYGAADANIAITQTPNTLWANCLANGSPYSNGVFELDMTGIVFYISKVNGAATRIAYYLLDGNTQYLLGSDKGISVQNTLTNTFTLGKVLVDLQKVRAAGIRQLTGFRLVLSAVNNRPILSYIQGGKGLAVFSPLGVV
jgi:hypothetical protein